MFPALSIPSVPSCAAHSLHVRFYGFMYMLCYAMSPSRVVSSSVLFFRCSPFYEALVQGSCLLKGLLPWFRESGVTHLSIQLRRINP